MADWMGLSQPRRRAGQGGHDQKGDQAGGEDEAGVGGASFQFAHVADYLQLGMRGRTSSMCGSCALTHSTVSSFAAKTDTWQ